ncbi:MAG: DUF1097 family protein [Actinobacteria bacterium]|nr:DUF1097 family protein [Thermoleophilia bacterium]MCB9012140.1 DUF1097 family protein [Actinomycetota bacterium]
MGARAQAILPLALVVGVLSFLWTEFSLNFTFHWVTSGDLGIGLELPSNFHLILPTAFVSWGMFFMAGGDNAAAGKVAVACIFGTVAALITMPLAFKTADLPDFWGIALWVGIFAFILVAILIAGDWYYVAGTFPAFASVFLWWIATGLDGWAPNGGGVGNSIQALTDAPGSGAFGGVISTPWQYVWLNTLVSLLCGVVLGVVSAKLAAALTPKPKTAEA